MSATRSKSSSTACTPTPLPKEVVCVDDFSTDGTRERLVELHAPREKIDRLDSPTLQYGKGGGLIRTALAAAWAIS